MSSRNEVLRGRSKVGDSRRSKMSVRANKGIIKIVGRVCPDCGHNKAWNNINKKNLKCSRCGGIFND